MENNQFTLETARSIYHKPLIDLVFEAQTVHRAHFDPNEIQACTLVNIQSGGCPEDCHWCAQSVHNTTNIALYPLMSVEEVLEKAKHAKTLGAMRVCMGAAWRRPTERQLERVTQMVEGIKALGLETCVTLGQLSCDQAKDLKSSGLDYYNHNLETSPEYFKSVTTTRQYTDRLTTIANAQACGLKTCSGGIIGMGESLDDQLKLVINLANLSPQPTSVPINYLTPIEGTPLKRKLEQEPQPLDEINLIRLIALTRILIPSAYIRLSCGRERLSESVQAFAFMAGANSFWVGDQLLTVNNRDVSQDNTMMAKLGMHFEPITATDNKLYAQTRDQAHDQTVI